MSSSPDERAVRSTANRPAVAILLQESITPAIFRPPTAHILQNQGQELDRHCSEKKGVLSHLLQSNSHHEHPLRFAPNWFDDVMMTLCNRTIQWCNPHGLHCFSLEPGPTWLLIVLGRQERAWGPVKIEHYSSPLLGRKVTRHGNEKHRPRFAGFKIWSRHWFKTVKSELIVDKVIRRFCCSFLWSFSSLYSQAMAFEIMEAIRSYPLHFSFKARTVFFFGCCFAAWGMAKASREFCRRKEFGNSLNIYQHFLLPGLSWTGQPSLCYVAPVPWDLANATRLDLVKSFLISILRLVHSDFTSTQINTLHTLRTHTHCARALSCLATRKVKTETEVKKGTCVLLCLGRRAVLEQAVHEKLLWLFDKFSKVCKKGTKYARTVTAFELDLLLDFRLPDSTSFIPTSCRKKRLGATLFFGKENSDFYSMGHISMGHCESCQRQKAIHSDDSCLQANDTRLEAFLTTLMSRWTTLKQRGNKASVAHTTMPKKACLYLCSLQLLLQLQKSESRERTREKWLLATKKSTVCGRRRKRQGKRNMMKRLRTVGEHLINPLSFNNWPSHTVYLAFLLHDRSLICKFSVEK